MVLPEFRFNFAGIYIHTIMSMVLIGSQVDSKSHSELAEALYSTELKQ